MRWPIGPQTFVGGTDDQSILRGLAPVSGARRAAGGGGVPLLLPVSSANPREAHFSLLWPFQVFVGRGGGTPGRPRFDPPAQAQGDQWPKARPKPKSTRGDQWEVRTGLKACSGIPGRVRGEGGQSGTVRQGPLEVRDEAAKSRYGVTSGKKAPGDLASS
ncbi:hypothetical protein ROHU_025786 [Labeo rohita]|uniref:Uncharacterized protein n=1 Tax=Labeo rohita TaxID=84645 RepID=A0A498MIT1_LABRO|nr:hypothetical protein ROHU_025786 [Labeo rohita]